MKKIYVMKVANKKGLDLFIGNTVRYITINGKQYNLIGAVGVADYTLGEEVIVCNYKTCNPLSYGIIDKLDIVDSETKGTFLVLK